MGSPIGEGWSTRTKHLVMALGMVLAVLIIVVGATMDSGVKGMGSALPGVLISIGSSILAAGIFYVLLEWIFRKGEHEDLANLAEVVSHEYPAKIEGILGSGLDGRIEAAVCRSLGDGISLRFPTHEFPANHYPNPVLNEVLRGDIEQTDEYWFSGASAKTLASRLICNAPGARTAIRVVIPDPADEHALAAQLRYNEITSGVKCRKEDVRDAIVLGLYGLFIVARHADPLGYTGVRVSFTSSPRSRRFEICRGVAAWVTFPKDHKDVKYPRTARFSRDSDVYQTHVQEMSEVERLAGDAKRSFDLSKMKSWNAVVSKIGLAGGDESILLARLSALMEEFEWVPRIELSKNID